MLSYPKIRRLLRWDHMGTERFLKQLYLRSVTVEVTGIKVEVPRDPDDSPILASLIAANADSLVTGDSDLLALCTDYPTVTPAELVLRL